MGKRVLAMTVIPIGIALVLGLLIVSILSLTGCTDNVASRGQSAVTLQRWLKNDVATKRIMNLRLPEAPIGLSIYKNAQASVKSSNAVLFDLPQSLSNHVVVMGAHAPNKVMQSSEEALTWIWLPDVTQDELNTHFTAIPTKEVMNRVSLSHQELNLKEAKGLEFYSALSSNKDSSTQDVIAYKKDFGAFLFHQKDETKLLGFLEKTLDANAFSWRESKNTWQLSNGLDVILTDLFTQFQGKPYDALHFVNLKTLADHSPKKVRFKEDAWLAVGLDPKVNMPSSTLFTEQGDLVLQLPQIDTPNSTPMDLSTLEYLLDGGTRPKLIASKDVDYVSIQHLDRVVKKAVIEKLPESKQNQLKMLNPILSLFHLNLERDIMGLLNRRTFLLINPENKRLFVLEPSASKTKTLKALKTHLASGSILNEAIFKGRTNGKSIINAETWQDQQLLSINPELGIPSKFTDWRMYVSDSGIYVANKDFFETSKPETLNSYLSFSQKEEVPTPWLTINMPNLPRSSKVIAPPVLREKNASIKTAVKSIEETGIVSFKTHMNFSTKGTRLLAGGYETVQDSAKINADTGAPSAVKPLIHTMQIEASYAVATALINALELSQDKIASK